MTNTLQPGRYRHYKGKDYLVIGVARHSETEELMAVYRTDYGDRSLWVRPLEMFQGTVEIDGIAVPRFQFVGESTEYSDSVAVEVDPFQCDRFRITGQQCCWHRKSKVSAGQRDGGRCMIFCFRDPDVHPVFAVLCQRPVFSVILPDSQLQFAVLN